MAVPSYEIYISDLANPSFHFVNNDIKEPSSIQNVDVIGGKLSIDTFAVNVFYRGEDIDGLRTLPFGTPVWYFKNGVLIYKFYINLITRVTKVEFKLECISSIGLLDKSSHIGGVYTGPTVEEVLDEIIGNIVEYSVDEDVATTKVFGYLPYQSRRENLHQLMFAYNISILRDADGDMRFTFLRSEESPDEIDSDRIYVDGRVEYPAVATEVYVVEHSYQFDDSEEEVTLFDNTSSAPANHKRVIFDTAPIYVPSLKTTESMVIEVAHPNFVVVSGTGTVKGIPYYDNISSINRTNETAGEEYVVAIKDATLVNVLNSEFVAERVMAYYSSAKIVKGDIKIANEATGHRYTFLDAFGEQVTGYLHKITTYASSFVKATSEFITGYQSLWFGNNYTNYIEVTEPCDIIVPEGCTRLRFVIIGGGEGGTYGTQSTTNSDWIHSSEMNAGEPGEAGEPGLGGNIREIVINDPTPGSYHCSIGTRGTGTSLYHSWNTNLVVLNPTNSFVTCPNGDIYSSADSSAYQCYSGIMNPFTGGVYGKIGKEGIDGGQGGRGSYSTGEDGEDVYYDGVLYAGGKGAKEYTFNFNHTETVVEVGGGGGSGAMAYVNGGSARRSSTYSHVDETASRGAADYEIANLFISIPNGTTGQVPEVMTDRACGGNAGCGAASIGGPGSKGAYNDDYYNQNNKLVYRDVRTGAEPGPAYGIDDFYYLEWRHGTPGRDGGRGIVIAYADVPLEIENVEKMPTPVLTSLSGVSSSAISFKATNLVEGNRYFVEKKILSVGPNDAGLADMNYQKYMSLGIWEPRGYFDVPSGDTEYDFTDDFGSLYYHIAPVQNATYLYRIKSYGSEDLGESEYSNELVVGFGLDQYESNPILALFPVYKDSVVGIDIFTGGTLENKPVTDSSAFENFQRRLLGELQWKDFLSQAANVIGLNDQQNKEVGKEYEYRLYVSGPSKIASQFCEPQSIVFPELTNKLFAPYIPLLDTETGSYLFSTLIKVYAIVADSRSERMEMGYCIPDRSYYIHSNYLTTTSLNPTTRYAYSLTMINRISESVESIDLILVNQAPTGGYDNSVNSNIVTFEYPSNQLVAFSDCSGYYSDGSIILEWNEINHAASYYVYRRYYDGSAWTSWSLLSSSIATETYTDSNVTQGTNYQYGIGAVGESGYLNSPGTYFTIVATDGAWAGIMQPPTLTSYYTYEPSADGYVGLITLEWDAVQYASGYMIERKKSDGLWDLLVYGLSSSTLIYTDDTTEFGETYSYRVTTLGNNSSTITMFMNPSNVETKTAINGEPVELAAPVFTLAVEDRFAGSVRISWTAISSTLSYLIQRKLHTGGSDTWVDISVSYTSMSYVDTATTIGQNYDYRMKAIGNEISVISSEFSDISVIEIEDPWASLIYLDSPTLTLAQVTDSLDRPVNTVSIVWTSVEHASGYKLERKLSTDSAWSTIYSGSLTTYSDQNLTWEATYDYRITAVGDLITYRDSMAVSDSIEIELPIAQQLATPVLSGSEITSGGDKAVALSWQVITGASSYKLERKLSEDVAYTVIESAISSSAVSYTDTAVHGGNTYIYRLTANGDSLYYTDSDPSVAIEVDLGWAIETVIYNNGSPASGYSFYGASGELVVLTTGNWNSGSLQITNVTEGSAQIAQALGDTVSNQSYGYYTAYRFTNPIDLTNYKQVVFTLKMPSSSEKKFNIPSGSTGYGWGYLYCRTNVTGSKADKTTYFANLSTNFEEYILDVSNISGERLIGIQLLAYTPSLSTEVWLKKVALYG